MAENRGAFSEITDYGLEKGNQKISTEMSALDLPSTRDPYACKLVRLNGIINGICGGACNIARRKASKNENPKVTRLCQGHNLRRQLARVVRLYESNRKNDSATDRCYGRVQRLELRHRTSFQRKLC
jgi:hypothetical protein